MVAPSIVYKTYRVFNALSLDVAIGACICSAFVASAIEVRLSSLILLTLGLSVWLIYTIDHLMDARQIGHKPHTYRHYFHQRYFKGITLATGAVFILQCVLLFNLPWATLLWGISLLAVVTVYFALLWAFRNYKIYHKEILIAIVYTCGIFLPSLSISRTSSPIFGWMMFLQLMLIAMANLLIFSLFETVSDKKDRQASLAIMLGAITTQKIIKGLIALGIILIVFNYFYFPFQLLKYSEGIFLLMNIALIVILTFPSLKKNDLYRMVGDAIFFIPILYFIF